MTSWEFAVPVPFPNGIYIAIYKVKTLLKVCLKGYIHIPQDMQNSIVKNKEFEFLDDFRFKKSRVD